MSRRQKQGQIDLFACIGTTLGPYRSTIGANIPEGRKWWVVEVELDSVPQEDLASEEDSLASGSGDEEEDDEDEEDEEDWEEQETYSVHQVPSDERYDMMEQVRFRGAIGNSSMVTWSQTRSRVCEDTGNTIGRGPRNPCANRQEVCSMIWATYGPEWRDWVTLN